MKKNLVYIFLPIFALVLVGAGCQSTTTTETTSDKTQEKQSTAVKNTDSTDTTQPKKTVNTSAQAKPITATVEIVE